MWGSGGRQSWKVHDFKPYERRFLDKMRAQYSNCAVRIDKKLLGPFLSTAVFTTLMECKSKSGWNDILVDLFLTGQGATICFISSAYCIYLSPFTDVKSTVSRPVRARSIVQSPDFLRLMNCPWLMQEMLYQLTTQIRRNVIFATNKHWTFSASLYLAISPLITLRSSEEGQFDDWWLWKTSFHSNGRCWRGFKKLPTLLYLKWKKSEAVAVDVQCGVRCFKRKWRTARWDL